LYLREPKYALFKIFTKIEIIPENTVPENVNTFFPRGKISATVFITVNLRLFGD
jgi:hypothetical protein